MCCCYFKIYTIFYYPFCSELLATYSLLLNAAQLGLVGPVIKINMRCCTRPDVP